MKLSQAIKLGAKKRPQQFDNGFFADRGGKVCSCAMGAAWEAVTGRTGFEPGENIINAFPALHEVKTLDPVLSRERQLFNIIADLNDIEHWSREKIANFVEGLGY